MAKAKKIAEKAEEAKAPQKKRNKLPPYKAVVLTTTVGAAIGDAFSEFQTLRDEMQEIVDNMSGSNMQHLPKYETAEAAQSELDEHADAEPSEVPEELAGITITYTEMVNRKKGRGPSRDIRCSNAQSLLQAAVDAIEASAEEIDGESKTAAEELAQELSEHIDFTVDFPGFYG